MLKGRGAFTHDGPDTAQIRGRIQCVAVAKIDVDLVGDGDFDTRDAKATLSLSRATERDHQRLRVGIGGIHSKVATGVPGGSDEEIEYRTRQIIDPEARVIVGQALRKQTANDTDRDYGYRDKSPRLPVLNISAQGVRRSENRRVG